MPIQTLEFGGEAYPAFQALGNAAQFAIPFARHVCVGRGVDVGCGRREWAFPGAILIDPVFGADAAHTYPHADLDYVFSSHCLEHLDDWVGALDHWGRSLKPGGVLFLYLPDYSQEYWRPWHNRKHVSCFVPRMIRDYLTSGGYTNVFVSGVDLNNSFTAVAEKVGVPTVEK